MYKIFLLLLSKWKELFDFTLLLLLQEIDEVLKEFKKLEKISVIFTDVDDHQKKIEIILD